MPNTLKHALPYPAPSAVPDVPYWLQQAMEAVDAKLEAALVKPAALLTRSSQVAITNASYQKVVLNVLEIDRGGIGSTATSRITITRPGLYVVSACVAFDSNATGVRYTAIYKNGSLHRYATGPASSGGPTAYEITVPMILAATDYLELYGVQNAVASLNTQATPHTATYLAAVFQED